MNKHEAAQHELSKQELTLHSTVSLSHFGVFPFHRLSAWHVLSTTPINVYPLSHAYLTTSPKEVPALVSTRPLLGLAGWPQETPTEMDIAKIIATYCVHGIHSVNMGSYEIEQAGKQ